MKNSSFLLLPEKKLFINIPSLKEAKIKMQTVLGIDLGTQSLKVLFYNFAEKKTVASESAALDLYQAEDGTAEQQAQWWTDALREALGKVDAAIRTDSATA